MGTLLNFRLLVWPQNPISWEGLVDIIPRTLIWALEARPTQWGRSAARGVLPRLRNQSLLFLMQAFCCCSSSRARSGQRCPRPASRQVCWQILPKLELL